MKLLCESKNGRVYLDGDDYIVEKLARNGSVVSTQNYKVKDWPLCPYDCYKDFGYQIVDMPYLSDLYDKYIKGKDVKSAYEKVQEKKKQEAEKKEDKGDSKDKKKKK